MPAALASRRYRLGLRMFGTWVWCLRYWLGGALVLAPIVTVGLDDALEIGVWPITLSILQWFVGATAAVWLHAWLPSRLALGVTRRELTVAYAVFGALTTAAMILLALAGFALEHLALQIAGAEPAAWSWMAGHAARYLLVTPIYFFAGAAIGILAGRLGSGGLTVVITMLTVGVVYVGALAVEFFDFRGDTSSWAFTAWAGGALALLATLIAVFALSLRSVPIRMKRG